MKYRTEEGADSLKLDVNQSISNRTGLSSEGVYLHSKYYVNPL